MNEERKTRTIETSISKVPVVIYTYLTGGEMMDLESFVANSGVRSVDGRSGAVSMNAGSAYIDRLKKLIDLIVVSVGGKTESKEKWEGIRALQGSEYSLLMKAIEAAASGLTEDEKKA